jgi:hypothetical protein
MGSFRPAPPRWQARSLRRIYAGAAPYSRGHAYSVIHPEHALTFDVDTDERQARPPETQRAQCLNKFASL